MKKIIIQKKAKKKNPSQSRLTCWPEYGIEITSYAWTGD
jgi:hypothetical protein